MLPFAPGTYASALAAGLGFGIVRLPGSLLRVAVSGCLGVLAFVLSVRLAPRAEAHFGDKDPGSHVIDEISGQFITLAIVFSLYGTDHGVSGPALSFVFFRLFDSVKPFPVGWAENLDGGWGVSLDDVFASVYAGAMTIIALGFLI